MKNLTVSQLSTINSEPHVFDLHLAVQLGIVNIYDIRRTIDRNLAELEMHGEVSVCGTETSSSGGRPGRGYYLNEGQALVICALSKTEKAAQVRKLLIDVFMAWRRGKTVHVDEHHRRPPTPALPAQGGSFHLQASSDMLTCKLTFFVPICDGMALVKHHIGA